MDRKTCDTELGKCMCDPNECECERLKAYHAGRTDAAPVPMYERCDV